MFWEIIQNITLFAIVIGSLQIFIDVYYKYLCPFGGEHDEDEDTIMRTQQRRMRHNNDIMDEGYVLVPRPLRNAGGVQQNPAAAAAANDMVVDNNNNQLNGNFIDANGNIFSLVGPNGDTNEINLRPELRRILVQTRHDNLM